jgi:hypothetical protein
MQAGLMPWLLVACVVHQLKHLLLKLLLPGLATTP